MNKLSIGIFVSGEGTTFKAINECIKLNLLQLNIEFVVCNNTIDNSKDLIEYCDNNNINLISDPYVFSSENRHKYQNELIKKICNYNPNFYLLLGWNLILSESFLIYPSIHSRLMLVF